MAITSDQFLAALKRNVTVPNSQIRFTNPDFLAMADEQMMILLVPVITSLRQEFFVRTDDEALVGGQSNYKIPYRSIGRTLRQIRIGNTSNDTVYDLDYIVPEDAYSYAGLVGDAQKYTLEGDEVIVLPTPSTNTTQVLKRSFELMPSKIVATSAAGIVSSADYTTGIVTMEAAITGFATGDVMDLVDGQSGCNTTALDITNTLVSANTVTFDPADLPLAPNVLKAGDYVCLSNETPVLQIPDEAFFVLVQAVTTKVLEAQGDFEGVQVSEGKLLKNIDALERLLAPRVKANAPTIFNQDGLIKNSFGRNWYAKYRL